MGLTVRAPFLGAAEGFERKIFCQKPFFLSESRLMAAAAAAASYVSRVGPS